MTKTATHVWWLGLLFTIGLGATTFAADAYVVRFNTEGRAAGNAQIRWVADVVFFNTTDSPAVVRLVDVSNGVRASNPGDLTIPPHRAASLMDSPPLDTMWSPSPAAAVWMIHMDVPAGIVVESRNEFYETFPGTAGLFPIARGKVSLPVFKQLVPAGRAQVHLGTDLSATTSRVNVGIYNAADTVATATIEVRRTCDDSLADSRTVTIPARTLVQIAGLSVGADACSDRATPSWIRYTSVTVDQPSISFVSNLNENAIPQNFEIGILPMVGLAVAHNGVF